MSHRDSTERAAAPQALDKANHYRILIRDLDLMARVGVHKHERDAPQPVRLNLTLDVRRGGTDFGVVDYCTVVDDVGRLLAQAHIDLLEDAAEQVIAMCSLDPRIAAVTVRIEKPNVVERAAFVGVEMMGERAQ